MRVMRRQQETAAVQEIEKEKHRVILSLEEDDFKKLRFLVSLNEKSNYNDALRQIIRFAHSLEMDELAGASK